MNYLDIKKDLKGFEGELGYKEVIKGIIGYETVTENETILNNIYEDYMNSDCSIFSDEMLDIIHKYIKDW